MFVYTLDVTPNCFDDLLGTIKCYNNIKILFFAPYFTEKSGIIIVASDGCLPRWQSDYSESSSQYIP